MVMTQGNTYPHINDFTNNNNSGDSISSSGYKVIKLNIEQTKKLHIFNKIACAH